jgi:hypothetical protein
MTGRRRRKKRDTYIMGEGKERKENPINKKEDPNAPLG